MEITRDRKNKTLRLTQVKYIKNMLEKFNKDKMNPISTPSDPRVKLNKNKNKATKKEINLF